MVRSLLSTKIRRRCMVISTKPRRRTSSTLSPKLGLLAASNTSRMQLLPKQQRMLILAHQCHFVCRSTQTQISADRCCSSHKHTQPVRVPPQQQQQHRSPLPSKLPASSPRKKHRRRQSRQAMAYVAGKQTNSTPSKKSSRVSSIALLPPRLLLRRRMVAKIKLDIVAHSAPQIFSTHYDKLLMLHNRFSL